jgi:hypothetical protein
MNWIQQKCGESHKTPPRVIKNPLSHDDYGEDPWDNLEFNLEEDSA